MGTDLLGGVGLPLHRDAIGRPSLLLTGASLRLVGALPVFDAQDVVGHAHDDGLVVWLRRSNNIS